MDNKRKILIFTDWYIPGFKAGGPVKSIKNLVSELEDDFDFFVFTSDRDLGDSESYSDIEVNEWNKLNNHKVFYCSPDFHSKKIIKSEFKKVNPDVIYINGVFSSKYSISPLLALRKIAKKIIISPRGMFNSGALSLKSKKKRAFISLSKLLRWYKSAEWHVTSKEEKIELSKHVKPLNRVTVVKNIVSANSISRKNHLIDTEVVKLVFVGRISKVKNLKFLIEVLNESRVEKRIQLDVIGSNEEKEYWNSCLGKVDSKSNYELNYIGEVSPNEIPSCLSNYDFFVSPTLNENFGHSIVEALQNGLPLLISNHTPWNDIELSNAGWALMLDKELWIKKIEEISKISSEDYQKIENGVSNYFYVEFNVAETREAYLKLFS